MNHRVLKSLPVTNIDQLEEPYFIKWNLILQGIFLFQGRLSKKKNPDDNLPPGVREFNENY